MIDDNTNPKVSPSQDEIMLALTTIYFGDIQFLDNVNRVTFGLISKRTNQNGYKGTNYR